MSRLPEDILNLAPCHIQVSRIFSQTVSPSYLLGPWILLPQAFSCLTNRPQRSKHWGWRKKIEDRPHIPACKMSLSLFSWATWLASWGRLSVWFLTGVSSYTERSSKRQNKKEPILPFHYNPQKLAHPSKGEDLPSVTFSKAASSPPANKRHQQPLLGFRSLPLWTGNMVMVNFPVIFEEWLHEFMQDTAPRTVFGSLMTSRWIGMTTPRIFSQQARDCFCLNPSRGH